MRNIYLYIYSFIVYLCGIKSGNVHRNKRFDGSLKGEYCQTPRKYMCTVVQRENNFMTIGDN